MLLISIVGVGRREAVERGFVGVVMLIPPAG
jgi:hypothetical protein